MIASHLCPEELELVHDPLFSRLIGDEQGLTPTFLGELG
jgi:hypothetical protein